VLNLNTPTQPLEIALASSRVGGSSQAWTSEARVPPISMLEWGTDCFWLEVRACDFSDRGHGIQSVFAGWQLGSIFC
jgi:hypothetical protein